MALHAEDSGVHDSPALTEAALVDVLRREQIVREPLAPLPMDADAELEVLAGLLAGAACPEDLAPLRPAHYSTALCAAAHAELELGPLESSDHLAARLAGEFGRRAWDLAGWLDVAAALSRGQLQQRADRVVELWRRRRLVCALRAVDSAVCAGAMSFDEGVGELRAVVMEVRAR